MKRWRITLAATLLLLTSALAVVGTSAAQALNNGVARTQRNWSDVANLWRTTEDITNAWDTGQANGYPMGIQNIVNVTVPLAGYAAPGGFNDPDMMEVGRGGMTDTEMRSHFALWAMLASPLIAGNDLRSMNSATQTILKNQSLIAINQDTLGLQSTQVSNDGTRRVLAKRLASVPGHGTVVYRVSGGGTTPPPSGTALVSAASGRCLDAPINATAGAKAQLWDCNGGTNQQWTLNSDGTVRGVQSGLCLDVDRNLTVNGTLVLLWTCSAAANQTMVPILTKLLRRH